VWTAASRTVEAASRFHSPPARRRDPCAMTKIVPASANAQSSAAEQDDEPQFIPCIPEGYLSILDLLAQPVGGKNGKSVRVFYPRKYFSASLEVFAVALIVCWLITLISNPNQIWDHPGYDIIGAYNPCYGWDYAPSSYFGLTICSVNVFLTWRYAWFEGLRTHLSNPDGWPICSIQTFAKWTPIMLAFSSNAWLLLWIIGPADGNWNAHTALFMIYAVSSYLVCMGNYLEMRWGPRSHVIRRQHTIFIVVYGFGSLLLPICYGIDLALYEPGTDPPVPPWLTQTSDFVWMGCIMFITVFTPPDLPLKLTVELVPDSTDAEEGGVDGWGAGGAVVGDD